MGPFPGGYREDSVIDFKWDANEENGVSITRATDGTITVCKGNSATQSTAGVTDTEDISIGTVTLNDYCT